MNRLSLKDGMPAISPQVISVPIIGEERMDTYITLTMKGTVDDMTESELEKKLAKLLVVVAVQPTQERQIQDDEDGLERAVSTTPSFVKDKYKGVELKVVYRKLRDGWGSSVTGIDFPVKATDEKKEVYANVICQARELLIANV